MSSPEEALERLGMGRLPPFDGPVIAPLNGRRIEVEPNLYKLEPWEKINFDLDEEWLIDGVVPRQGVGLLYGASQSFKSFIATHMGLCVALGQRWAEQQTVGGPVVYLAAEGATGLRKRRQGYIMTGRAPAEGVGFALLSASPDLGTAAGDYDRLVRAIESAGIKPSLIIVDTVAKVIGGADENGQGMAQFLVNAEAMAQHFGCFVLAVHHVGWEQAAKDRPRGWSGLPAALDLQILSERKTGEMFATVTIQKLKDEPSGLRLAIRMQRVVLGLSKTGREVSTLIVEAVEEAGTRTSAPVKALPAKSARLLMAVIDEAIDVHGTDIQPFEASGQMVRAVAEKHVRDRYFKRLAEKADPGEDEKKRHDRQRNGFKRAIKSVIDAQTIVAAEYKGERFLWLP